MRNLAIVSTSLGIVIAAILLLQLNGANAELDTTRNQLEAAQAQNEQLIADLATAREQIDSKIAENETLTADLEATTERLTTKTAENETLTADLQATTERLTAKTAENETLTADLQATTERLTAKTAENETLTADLEATTGRLTAKTAENATLTADLEATTGRLTAKTAENATLSADLEATTGRLTAKTAENETLTANLATVTERLETITTQLADKTSEHQALTAKHDALVEEGGTLESVKGQIMTLNSRVESLHSQIGRLNSDITELERLRRPLIVDSHTAGFKCTGSMEPKITCLDTATWLTNFYPEDIVIGAVISFTPTAECNLTSSRVAHRVMSVRRGASGDTYYWPKGDANSQDDGCWIPYTNVNGYIIELHRNTNLENSALRNRVNSASAAWDEARQNYEQRRLAYCGSVTGACTLSGARYNEVIRLRNIYQAAYGAWEVVYREARQ